MRRKPVPKRDAIWGELELSENLLKIRNTTLQPISSDNSYSLSFKNFKDFDFTDYDNAKDIFKGFTLIEKSFTFKDLKKVDIGATTLEHNDIYEQLDNKLIYEDDIEFCKLNLWNKATLICYEVKQVLYIVTIMKPEIQ